jgi:arsenate reductase
MNILFVCTHNRCRSILAEAIGRKLSRNIDTNIAFRSAGSQPAGKIHPLTLQYLAEHNIPADELQSQGWDEFAEWAPNVVITVCDSAAGEPCPLWLGKALKIHWGLPDPSKIESDEKAQAEAFNSVIKILTERITKVLTADPGSMDSAEQQQFLQDLGNNNG